MNFVTFITRDWVMLTSGFDHSNLPIVRLTIVAILHIGPSFRFHLVLKGKFGKTLMKLML